MTETFVYVTYIETSPEKLWAALTTPEFTTRYWNGRRITSDWRPGSPVRFEHDYDEGGEDWGEVLAVEQLRRLSYGRPDSAVTFELTPHDDVVRLTVTHTGVGEQVGSGWYFILANLKTLLETGSPLPMPEKVLAAYR